MPTRSIQSHLMLLFLTVSIPLLTIVGFDIYTDIQQTIHHTKNSLKILEHMMLSNTGSRIDNSRQILERLAARPLVKRVDSKNCDGILQELVILNPSYANVSYTDLQGRVVCSGVPQPGGKLINIGKTQWFQKFLKERRFTVGQPFYGPISHK